MYNGDDIKNHNASRKLQILKGFSEVQDVIEKAKNRQVGEVHSNGKWVWTSIGNGKFDWRVKDSKKNKADEKLKNTVDDAKKTLTIIETIGPSVYNRMKKLDMIDSEQKPSQSDIYEVLNEQHEDGYSISVDENLSSKDYQDIERFIENKWLKENKNN